MKIAVTAEDTDRFVTLDVEHNEVVENVKALVEVELGIAMVNQVMLFDGREMQNNEILSAVGVKENDILLVKLRLTADPRFPRASQLLQAVEKNPAILIQLRLNNPTLARSIDSRNMMEIETFMAEQEKLKRQQELEQIRRISALNADPFDPAAQAAIEEEIRMQNVMENMETALEHQPEAFASVHMLYIDMSVNGVAIKAFVDSGAQITVMSQRCAEQCSLMRLIDRRVSGTVRGVGSSKIIGRIHVAAVKIGEQFFQCSFTVLENQDVDFLLGLDMLRRHQCSIDLRSNVLRIGDQAVPFLAEKDIPSHDREPMDSDMPSASSSAPHTTPAPSPAASLPSPPPAATPTTATPAPAPAPYPSAPPTRPPPSEFPEEKVSRLMALGFPRETAVAALRQFRGNEEFAASFLFGQMGGGF